MTNLALRKVSLLAALTITEEKSFSNGNGIGLEEFVKAGMEFNCGDDYLDTMKANIHRNLYK